MRCTSSSGVAPCQMYRERPLPRIHTPVTRGQVFRPDAAERCDARIDDALRECLSEFVRCIPRSVAGFGDAVEDRAEKKVVFRRVRCELLERMARAAYQASESGGDLRVAGVQVHSSDAVLPGQIQMILQSQGEDIVRAEALRSSDACRSRADCRFAQMHLDRLFREQNPDRLRFRTQRTASAMTMMRIILRTRRV